ncbi:L-aspartate oxidase [Caldicellulosiruptor saccharolyticus DSM 8903]|uniref:L-aspartate oxidase n=1 Tax=Caldicellulosiruptor saccharolyticus (strain ATCC 43494 / DSM 8903 / Tp8T 6331) TaxID=351627 RepID=A4XKC8_CALS8|nr:MULTISPECIES: L-aspartate oxidase [Caldicellulosiruptor]ABP67363.1 L-aspartate oxidase [Caldicellulosiruptor saccharolyticus DSM 8903]
MVEFKRYCVDFDTKSDDVLKFDVVIVGTGVAGLYTTINLDRSLKIALITKESIQISNTTLAQGGIAAPLSQDDSPDIHYMDTIKAGAGLCDTHMVRILVDEAIENINILLKMNIPFDLDDEGEIVLGQEGAHSRRRIVHASGDATGRIISEHLGLKLKSYNNVTVFENTFLVDILTDDDKAIGVVLKRKDKNLIIFARYIVLASGGYGYLYKYTTNPEVTTGDGCAAALRCGTKLVDMELVQFHPTVLYHEKNKSFLISEAVRGEGGILYNINNERFMPMYHPQAELAPRDIVSRSIYFEMKRTNSHNVFLDITHLNSQFIKKRFPNIYKTCLELGLDITKERIPVAPAQHYSMGGVLADEFGKTTVENLFVCGEAAGTRVHGANRLASNSLLEGLVFGRRIAEYINSRNIGEVKEKDVHYFSKDSEEFKGDVISEIEILRSKMSEFAGIVRNNEGLENLISYILDKLSTLSKVKLQTPKQIEYYNMLLIGYTVVSAALMRKESRGSHYREDFPYQDDVNWKKHLVFSLNGWEVLE